MKKQTIHLFWIVVALLGTGTLPSFAEEPKPVYLFEVKGSIDLAVARYITRGLEEARKAQASAVVIQLDTPGGMDGSMRKIVQEILNSPTPVIVYVSPQGARAASAGVFITLAAHVSAMAPGTNIGAAHPVHIGPGESAVGRKEGEKPSVMEEKMTNDAVAYIQSIADIRGRDPVLSEEMVRENRSSTADEAKERKMVDLVAKDMDDLFAQVEGLQLKTVFGVETLSLKGLPQKAVPMSAVEKGLHQIAHPNIAYIVLLLGIYGMIFELSTPGAVFPGVLGAILLVMGFVALEMLEVNWAGIALIFLALLFFIADIKLPGYGALTVGGIVAFLLGSSFLFPGARLPHLKLPWKTIGAATAVTAGFFIFIVGAGIRALGKKVTSGIQGLIGAEGMAKTDLKPEGLVHVQGEEWMARAHQVLRKGTRVRVVKLEGLTVHVEAVEEDS